MRPGPLDTRLPATLDGAPHSWGGAASACSGHSGLPEDAAAGSISPVPREVVARFTAIATLEELLGTFAGLHVDSDQEPIHARGRLDSGIHFVVDRDRTRRTLYPQTVTGRHVISRDSGRRFVTRLRRELAEDARWEVADG